MIRAKIYVARIVSKVMRELAGPELDLLKLVVATIQRRTLDRAIEHGNVSTLGM